MDNEKSKNEPRIVFTEEHKKEWKIMPPEPMDKGIYLPTEDGEWVNTLQLQKELAELKEAMRLTSEYKLHGVSKLLFNTVVKRIEIIEKSFKEIGWFE